MPETRVETQVVRPLKDSEKKYFQKLTDKASMHMDRFKEYQDLMQAMAETLVEENQTVDLDNGVIMERVEVEVDEPDISPEDHDPEEDALPEDEG